MLRCASGRPAAAAATASALALLRWHAWGGRRRVGSRASVADGVHCTGVPAAAFAEPQPNRQHTSAAALVSLRGVAGSAPAAPHLEQAGCLPQVAAAVGQQEEGQASAVQHSQRICRGWKGQREARDQAGWREEEQPRRRRRGRGPNLLHRGVLAGRVHGQRGAAPSPALLTARPQPPAPCLRCGAAR